MLITRLFHTSIDVCWCLLFPSDLKYCDPAESSVLSVLASLPNSVWAWKQIFSPIMAATAVRGTHRNGALALPS